MSSTATARKRYVILTTFTDDIGREAGICPDDAFGVWAERKGLDGYTPVGAVSIKVWDCKALRFYVSSGDLVEEALIVPAEALEGPDA